MPLYKAPILKSYQKHPSIIVTGIIVKLALLA